MIIFDKYSREVNMIWRNSAQRYGAVSITLHWVMAVLMVTFGSPKTLSFQARS
jgi:hypothetical protein